MDNLLLDCEVQFRGKSVWIQAPDEAIARELKSSFYWLASWAKNLNKRDVRVSFPGCRRPYQVPACLAASAEPLDENFPIPAIPELPKEQNLRGVIQSVTELDWNAIAGGINPIYITQLSDQRNLFLNQSAVSAQSGKPPADFLAATAHSLNFEDELVNRCRFIVGDRSLSEYSYEAMRWFRDESGMWIRRRMQFVSNFWRVEYLGQSCWMGEVLQATPVESFVD